MRWGAFGCKIALKKRTKKKTNSRNSNHPKTNQPVIVRMERNQRLRTENNVYMNYFVIGYRNDPYESNI